MTRLEGRGIVVRTHQCRSPVEDPLCSIPPGIDRDAVPVGGEVSRRDAEGRARRAPHPAALEPDGRIARPVAQRSQGQLKMDPAGDAEPPGARGHRLTL